MGGRGAKVKLQCRMGGGLRHILDAVVGESVVHDTAAVVGDREPVMIWF